MLKVKICGLNTRESVTAAVDGGASHVGFIFYPPSPRAVTPERAGEIASGAPGSVARVAVFVDPSDQEIDAVVQALSPAILQLHGAETPERIDAVKRRFGLPVMKAIRVSTAMDIQAAKAYDGIADMFLFDAKPPKDAKGMLPGGNGLAFDWTLLAAFQGATPWFLSGGLELENVEQALSISDAKAVDVSSGVEDRPGVKNPGKISAFLQTVKARNPTKS
jgi:phosphoribosylanthranilate isomerase